MITIKLDSLLKDKGITAKELCRYVDITEANMSILRSGKAKGIRFETLDRICTYLGVKPGDLIDHKGENNEENV
jgi:putative transcriptional regulator